MIVAGVVLIAGELAVFTERNDMKPVAVSVEVVFGVFLVPFNTILLAEFVSFSPGFGFDANELDVAGIAVFLDEVMAEFM